MLGVVPRKIIYVDFPLDYFQWVFYYAPYKREFFNFWVRYIKISNSKVSDFLIGG